MGFALPVEPNAVGPVLRPQVTCEQSQPGNHDYDAGFPSCLVYDADLPAVTTGGSGDLIPKLLPATAYDFAPGSHIRVAGSPRAPPVGKSGFLAANRGVFPSGGDRLLGTLGPARLNHADELAATIQRVEGAGGNIAWREGQFGFSPAMGQPGRVILDPNASISAVRHEVGHFFDDLGRGHPGMGYYLQNPGARWASEYSSYIREISLARRVGDRQAAWQLLRDARAERNAILGR